MSRIKNELRMVTKKVDIDVSDLYAFGYLDVEIEGDANLMPHRFWGFDELRDQQAGADKTVGAPRNYEQEALDSLFFIGRRPANWNALQRDYRKHRFGFSQLAMKHALMCVGKDVNKKLTKQALKRWIRVMSDADGELFEVFTPVPPVLYVKEARNAGMSGGMVPRSRSYFPPGWRAKFTVRFDPHHIGYKTVARLVVKAGIANGLGSFRPNGKMSSGDWGTWKVVDVQLRMPEGMDVPEEPLEALATKKRAARKTAAPRERKEVADLRPSKMPTRRRGTGRVAIGRKSG